MALRAVPADAERTAPDPRRRTALTAIPVAPPMVVPDVSVTNVTLPHARTDLRISDAARQGALTAHALTAGGLLLLGGRVVDVSGRKRARPGRVRMLLAAVRPPDPGAPYGRPEPGYRRSAGRPFPPHPRTDGDLP